MSLVEIGEVSSEAADDANIPVDIWLTHLSESEADDADHRWRLSADNYCPRKNAVYQEAYDVRASTREELVEIVKKWRQIYQDAVNILDKMIAGKEDHLYYWYPSEESEKKE